MARNVIRTVYQFDELSESAKEKAREWFRNGMEIFEYADSVIEDAATIADILGIDLHLRPVPLMGGGTRYDPCIYWSGFCGQGDGACFEGSYTYNPGFRKALAQYIGDESKGDKELHRIARELQALQRRNFYRLTASMAHRGHYQHSGCMSVDVERTDDVDVSESDSADLAQIMRDFADWIYARIEAEYEYRMSNACVDENIRCNGYEFDEDGNRYC